MECPFCKMPMTNGYVSMRTSGGVVYFSKERLSWMTGGLGKEKEAILDDFPDNYSRPAYKCNNCNAIVMEGKASPTRVDTVRVAEAEIERERLKDRIRQSSRF